MMLGTVKAMFLFLMIYQYSIPIVVSHTCNYRIPKIKELVNGVLIDELPPHFRRKRATSSNLRIHFDYQSSLTSSPFANAIKNDILEPAKFQLQQMIVPKAPTNGVLRVDRACIGASYRLSKNNTKGCSYGCATTTSCLGIDVPEKYLKKCVTINSSQDIFYSGTEGSGIIDADIVLLVTYNSCDGQTLAFAGSCFSESILDRPILGIMNLCSDKIQPNTRKKENVKIVMHEMIHALGLAVDKYAFYRYDNGAPIVRRNMYGWPDEGFGQDNRYYMWNDKIIKKVIRSRESVFSRYTLEFDAFVLPNVLAAVRNHFNCATIDAVDIENYGSSGSALSHFDEYLLSNELMTAVSNNEVDTLSNITLALLQDTGWYTVNFSKALILDYGYQKGCTLPQKGCYSYMKSQTSTPINLDPFCNRIDSGKAFGCSRFKDYFHLCSLMRYGKVHSEYQYFTSLSGVYSDDALNYAGTSPFNEYCPTYQVYTDPSYVCSNEFNNNVYNPKNAVQSYFGNDSMCFINEMYNSQNRIYGASCQKYIMHQKPNNLTIIVGSKSLECPSSLIHTFKLGDGSEVIIRCPDDLRSIDQMSLTNRFQMSISFITCIIMEIFYLIY